MKEFKKYGGKVDQALVIVAANKMDLAGVVDLTDTRIWAEQQGFKFVQTSAATAEGTSSLLYLILAFSEYFVFCRKLESRICVRSQLKFWPFWKL